MKLQEIVGNKSIVIVCGNLASGKGKYTREFYPHYEHVGVSSIVKELTNLKTRSELSSTADLDGAIVHELIKKIDPHNKVVVEGIRQPSILHALVKHYGSSIKDVVWLDVSKEELKNRFKNRDAKKDDLPFEKALATDQELGIEDVEAYIRKHGRAVKY